MNVDIGEGFPHDAELLRYATSANICCGEHAGSWDLTSKTIELCRMRGVRVGMHPGFPDRDSMGRRSPTADELDGWFDSLMTQADRFLEAATPQYFKPHGAWYNLICAPRTEASEIHGAAAGIMFGFCQRYRIPPMLMADAGYGHLALYGCKPIREGFAERGYDDNGSLVRRGEPGALLTDREAIAAQVLNLAPKVDSICVHGDSPNCVETVRLVVDTLKSGGFQVTSEP